MRSPSFVWAQCVGWAITMLPRRREQYHGDIAMSGDSSGSEIFQLEYSDKLGHSKFVFCHHSIHQARQIEPTSYQVSDQAVSMERDGLLANADDPGLLAYVKPNLRECVPQSFTKTIAASRERRFHPTTASEGHSNEASSRSLSKFISFRTRHQ